MFNLICITNRNLVKEDFLERIEKIVSARPKAIILREKDLSQQEYEIIAKKVIEICEKYDTVCILHSFYTVAYRLDCRAIHMPLFMLREMSEAERKTFDILGASCHSVEEAREAENLGCTYITAGHIFKTDCKKGLQERGLDFLQRVCEAVSIPVYAIGGIAPENSSDVIKSGAKGGCIMSTAMKCENPLEYFGEFNRTRR